MKSKFMTWLHSKCFSKKESVKDFTKSNYANDLSKNSNTTVVDEFSTLAVKVGETWLNRCWKNEYDGMDYEGKNNPFEDLTDHVKVYGVRIEDIKRSRDGRTFYVKVSNTFYDPYEINDFLNRYFKIK